MRSRSQSLKVFPHFPSGPFSSRLLHCLHLWSSFLSYPLCPLILLMNASFPNPHALSQPDTTEGEEKVRVAHEQHKREEERRECLILFLNQQGRKGISLSCLSHAHSVSIKSWWRSVDPDKERKTFILSPSYVHAVERKTKHAMTLFSLIRIEERTMYHTEASVKRHGKDQSRDELVIPSFPCFLLSCCSC